MEAYLLQANVLQAIHMNSPPSQVKYLKKYNLAHSQKHCKNEKLAIGFQEENGFFQKMIQLACKNMNSYGNRRIVHKGNLMEYLQGVPTGNFCKKKKSVNYHQFQHKRSKSAKMFVPQNYQNSQQIKFHKYTSGNLHKIAKDIPISNQYKDKGHLGATHSNSFGNSPRTQFYDFDIGIIKQRAKICVISEDRRKFNLLSPQRFKVEQNVIEQRQKQDNKRNNQKKNEDDQILVQTNQNKENCHKKCKYISQKQKKKKYFQIKNVKRTKNLTADDIIGQFRQNQRKQNTHFNMKTSLNVQQHKPMSNKQLKERSLQIMRKHNFTQSRTSQFFNFLENWNTN